MKLFWLGLVLLAFATAASGENVGKSEAALGDMAENFVKIAGWANESEATMAVGLKPTAWRAATSSARGTFNQTWAQENDQHKKL